MYSSRVMCHLSLAFIYAPHQKTIGSQLFLVRFQAVVLVKPSLHLEIPSPVRSQLPTGLDIHQTAWVQLYGYSCMYYHAVQRSFSNAKFVVSQLASYYYKFVDFNTKSQLYSCIAMQPTSYIVTAKIYTQHWCLMCYKTSILKIRSIHLTSNYNYMNDCSIYAYIKLGLRQICQHHLRHKRPANYASIIGYNQIDIL